MRLTSVRLAFAALLAVFLAATAVLGAKTVSAGPQPPQAPTYNFTDINSAGGNAATGDRISGQIDAYLGQLQAFRKAVPVFQRNVFLAMAGIALILALLALTLPGALNYLRLGMLAAALLVLGYGLWRTLVPLPDYAPTGSINLLTLVAAGAPAPAGFASRFLRFALSFVGLLLLLLVGVLRLTDWTEFGAARAATTTGASAEGPSETPAAEPTPGVPEPTWAPRTVAADEPAASTAGLPEASWPPPAATPGDPDPPAAGR